MIITKTLPIYEDCDTWYYGDELFTTETVVDHDMELVLADTEEESEEAEESEGGTD